MTWTTMLIVLAIAFLWFRIGDAMKEAGKLYRKIDYQSNRITELEGRIMRMKDREWRRLNPQHDY